MKDRRMARVRVTKDIFLATLHLPCETEILTIRIADDPRDLEMVVQHPDLPPIDDSGTIPLASPTISEHRITFEGWGL